MTQKRRKRVTSKTRKVLSHSMGMTISLEVIRQLGATRFLNIIANAVRSVADMHPRTERTDGAASGTTSKAVSSGVATVCITVKYDAGDL